jgi:hypothetical protein
MDTSGSQIQIKNHSGMQRPSKIVMNNLHSKCQLNQSIHVPLLPRPVSKHKNEIQEVRKFEGDHCREREQKNERTGKQLRPARTRCTAMSEECGL